MKKYILMALLLISIISCKNKPFTGYVVGKTFIPLHMDDEQEHRVKVAIVVPIHPAPMVVHHHTPEMIKDQYIVDVANSEVVRHAFVTKQVFDATHLFDKVTIH